MLNKLINFITFYLCCLNFPVYASISLPSVCYVDQLSNFLFVLYKFSFVCINFSAECLLCCILLIFFPVSIICVGFPRQGLAPFGYVKSSSHPYGQPKVFIPKKTWPKSLRFIEPRLDADGKTWLAPPFSVHETGVVTLTDDGEFKGHYKIQKDGRTMWTLHRPLAISLPGLICSKNLFHSMCIVVEKKVLPLVIFVLTPPRPPTLFPSLHVYSHSLYAYSALLYTLLCSTLTVAWIVSWRCTNSRFGQRSSN